MDTQEKQIKEKIVVIGDIHGQLTLLKSLLSEIEKKLSQKVIYEDYTLVFVGDYVDRGKEIKETIQFLIDLRKSRKDNTTIYIIGNHDHALALYLGLWEEPYKDCFKNTYNDYKQKYQFEKNRGNQTENMHLQGKRYVNSYSGDTTLESYNAKDNIELLEKMPKDHIDFFKNLEWIYETNNYIFVHAGFDAKRSLDEQKKELINKDLSIKRVEQLSSRVYCDELSHPDTNKTIVSGHVTIGCALISKKRILCDTSGGVGKKLSAVILPENIIVTNLL